ASKKLKKIRLLITSLDEQNSSRKKDLNDKHLPVLENVDINVDVDSTKQKNPQKRDSPKNKINRMGKKNRQKGNPEAYHQDGKTNPFE
ncbi:14355_t:CDS:1, partial [Acaulospora morrowiae]